MGRYSNEIVIGVLASQMIQSKTIPVFETKFNSDTGEPYQRNFEQQVYCFNGQEYEEEEELSDALDELGLQTFPTQHGIWELSDMVIGKEVSTSNDGQCVKIDATPSDPVWTQTQDIIKSTGCSAQVSLFSVLEYN